MELIRSFIAIELPDELRQALKNLQDTLKKGNQAVVRWVDPAGIHLTLKFLGSVPSDRINGIIEAMGQSVQGVSPFRLETGAPGAFPNLERPRVVWLGVGGEVDRLARLQATIEANIVPLGFAAEGRFSPHLTLGRVRDTASTEERRRLGKIIAATTLEIAYSIAVGSVNLIRSDLTPKGAIYRRLGSVELPTD